MRQISIRIVFIGVFLSALITNVKAQEIKLGGGLIIGTERPSIGLKAKGTYDLEFLLENLDASADLSIFIPVSLDNTTYKRWELNVDGHYMFNEISDFKFYALGGIGIVHYNREAKIGVINSTTRGTSIGLNIGVGANYNISEGILGFGEFKYGLGVYDQAELSFGVLFDL